MIHVWVIYLHLPYKSTIHVGQYTVRPMDPSWIIFFFFVNRPASSLSQKKGSHRSQGHEFLNINPVKRTVASVRCVRCVTS